VPQEVVTVNGLSTSVTATQNIINLSAPSCSVAENVTDSEGGAVDDSADILARCATTIPAGSLRASTSDLVASGT